MRKSIALKTLLRSPIKTLLTFLLIAAASFALFSRVTDYAVTTRETEHAKSLYHAVASLDNEVPDRNMTIANVLSPDMTRGMYYAKNYEIKDKPWLTDREEEEFSSLPGVTLADTVYMTAGRVEGTASELTFSSAVDLSKSPLVEDFYCRTYFNVRAQGVETDLPMIVTSDMMRDIGADCPVDYAEGYDVTAFEGTAQVCVVGKQLADSLGISLGDELAIMSDLLYFQLEYAKGSEEYSVGKYRPYKVIGIAQTEEESVGGSLFVGIRSDLQALFSMDIQFEMEHCEFTLADNERVAELKTLLEEKVDESAAYTNNPNYVLDTGGLTNIERIRGLLEALFPIAVAAAVLIGLFGPLLVILQSAGEAAFLRILGVTKKRARCMLVFEQVILSIAGIVLVAGGISLYDPGSFAKGIGTFAACFGLYLLGSACGAAAAAVQVTRGRLLALLQVKE